MIRIARGRRIAIVVLLLLAMINGQASLCLAQSAVGADGTVTDVVVGHNTKGPYTLSWTDIDTRSASVTLDGRMLKKGADYQIDFAKGVIAFDRMLVNDALVRVSYKTTPGKSKANNATMDLPVNLNLVESQNASLSVTGLYTQDDPKKGEAAKTIVGLGGSRSWASTKLKSQFLVSQTNADTKASEDASTWEKSAMTLGTETKLGGITFSGDYTHAGNSFQGAKQYNTGLGKNAANLAASFSNGKFLQAAMKFNKTSDTTDAAKGAYSQVTEQSMAISPVDGTKLSIAHSNTETGNSSGTSKVVDASTLKVDQSLGDSTKVAMALDTTKITNNGKEDVVDKQTIALNTTPIEGVNVQATRVDQESKLNGAATATSAAVEVKSPVGVNVKVAASQNESAKDGQEQNMTAAVSLNPNQAISLKANITNGDSEKKGQTAKSDINLQLKTGTMQLAASMSDNTQNDKQQSQRDISLVSTPAQFAKVTAQFTQKSVNDNDNVTKSAALELSPLANTRLRTGFKSVEEGDNVLTIHDYGAETSVANIFSISGSFRDRQLMNGVADDTTSVKMAIKPISSLSFTGEYAENPEDAKTGAVQTMNTTGLGVKMCIGSLGINTNYTAKEEYKINRLSDERKVGLELPAIGGSLTTDYQFSRLLASSQLRTRTYSLGFKRNVGNDFNLSLTSYYTETLNDRMILNDKTEMGARIDFGSKF